MREESLIEALQDINDIKCAIEGIVYAENKIDREQRRYEIAKSAMPFFQHVFKDNYQFIAKCAVKQADALIAELKKTNEKEKICQSIYK